MAAVEVDAGDVVRLILQFCQENHLTETVAALQAETHISLNTVDSIEMFTLDIQNGNWDAVLKVTSTLSLPQNKLFDLYEQVVIELIELRENDTAHALLRLSKPMMLMMTEDPTRYRRLEHLQTRTYFEPREAYPDGTSKEKRRAAIAQALSTEVTVVPPSRLLALIGHALKWQQYQGNLPQGVEFDLFRGAAAQRLVDDETYPRTRAHSFKFGEGSHPEAVAFSPDGLYLATGSTDGFIEVWNPSSGKLNTDLKYQAEENLMLHNNASVLSLAFSTDSELLASGSSDGKIKVWKIRSGQCLRRFDGDHTGGVSSLVFMRDGTQILSGSSDHIIRIFGLKSGRMLKEFRGHTSFVSSALFNYDSSQIVSASADGTVKVWDARTCDCLRTFKAPGVADARDVAINCILPVPDNLENFVLCNRSPTIHIVSIGGKSIKSLTSGKTVDFVTAAVSPRGEWIYAVGEDHVLYSFSVTEGKLKHMMKLHEGAVRAMAHHPHRNMLATASTEGNMKTWKS